MKKILATTFLCICSSISYAAQFPLTVKAENGTIILQKKPERIIVLEFGLLDELKLLGIKPVGVGKSDSSEGQDPVYLQEFLKDIPGVGTRDEPSLEAIAKLKPDLILGEVSFISKLGPQLNKIAPTVLLNGILGDTEVQKKNLQILSEITDRESRVSAIVKNHDQIRNNAIAMAQKSPQKKVLIGYITPSGVFRALSSNAIATPILKDLNKINLIQEKSSQHRVEVTVEGIINMNPDQIAILLTDGDLSPYKKLQENPLWKDVRAFKGNQIYFLDRNVWAKTHGIEAMQIKYQEAIESGFLAGIPHNKILMN
ncbi:iron-siderophore ABC transporter substrate-binding protein [Fluviispira sanaruensis]|uniref:Iron-siderophore ABC transporter substrate-binding protein n=1 Tax=Fluviispira sanaruensis TaxID=2493639 RepID=A0A4P2VM90_FLUSA|nr:iron-siderophore ABC transporter substrate-binding protein [Fluviispira sanaruensis]BBH53134.1 iron-siderophore ABC transporter substrate-binding protein [Fluviispira sanaruensis]